MAMRTDEQYVQPHSQNVPSGGVGTGEVDEFGGGTEVSEIRGCEKARVRGRRGRKKMDFILEGNSLVMGFCDKWRVVKVNEEGMEWVWHRVLARFILFAGNCLRVMSSC